MNTNTGNLCYPQDLEKQVIIYLTGLGVWVEGYLSDKMASQEMELDIKYLNNEILKFRAIWFKT